MTASCVTGRMSSLRLLAAFAFSLVMITTAVASLFAQRNAMPKEWLIERLTVAEAEGRYTPPRRTTAQSVFRTSRSPLGFQNAEWEKLKRQMRPGDELWT
jgi:hypothetical protein